MRFFRRLCSYSLHHRLRAASRLRDISSLSVKIKLLIEMSALPSSHSLRNPGKPVQTTRKRNTGQSDAQKATRLLSATANKRAADALRDALNNVRDAQELAICDIARDHKKKET